MSKNELCHVIVCVIAITLSNVIDIIAIAIILAKLVLFIYLAVIIITALLPTPATTFLHMNMNVLKHLPSPAYEGAQLIIYIQHGCWMQSAIVYSLNHGNTTSFGLYLNPIF